MTDHIPSPATDGLREAIEALAARYEHENGGYLWGVAEDLRAVLAAHPAAPSETATERCTCPDDEFLTDAPCRVHDQPHAWQRDWGIERDSAVDAQFEADLTAIRAAEQAVDLNAPVSGPAPPVSSDEETQP